jgi:hypothetical protein
MPTVYLISYSAYDVGRSYKAQRQLQRARARGPYYALALPGINCHHWQIPPRDYCRQYTGVHSIIQSFVIQVYCATLEYTVHSDTTPGQACADSRGSIGAQNQYGVPERHAGRLPRDHLRLRYAPKRSYCRDNRTAPTEAGHRRCDSASTPETPTRRSVLSSHVH